MSDLPDDYPEIVLFDREGNRIESYREWIRMCEDDSYRIVELSSIDHPDYDDLLYVSTVWMRGLDIGPGHYSAGATHTPLLFETAVFVDEPFHGQIIDERSRRYATVTAARTGHFEVVAALCGDVGRAEQFMPGRNVFPN